MVTLEVEYIIIFLTYILPSFNGEGIFFFRFFNPHLTVGERVVIRVVTHSSMLTPPFGQKKKARKSPHLFFTSLIAGHCV